MGRNSRLTDQQTDEVSEYQSKRDRRASLILYVLKLQEIVDESTVFGEVIGDTIIFDKGKMNEFIEGMKGSVNEIIEELEDRPRGGMTNRQCAVKRLQRYMNNGVLLEDEINDING